MPVSEIGALKGEGSGIQRRWQRLLVLAKNSGGVAKGKMSLLFLPDPNKHFLSGPNKHTHM
jgi:hypothetical protein